MDTQGIFPEKRTLRFVKYWQMSMLHLEKYFVYSGALIYENSLVAWYTTILFKNILMMLQLSVEFFAKIIVSSENVRNGTLTLECPNFTLKSLWSWNTSFMKLSSKNLRKENKNICWWRIALTDTSRRYINLYMNPIN